MKADVTEDVKTAEKLLKEVTDRNKKALLEAYCLIASKKKENMEKALTKFYEIMTNDRSAPVAATSPGGAEKVNVPCLVGMATALQMMKQTPKARNHLKRVAKAQYNQEEADEFERGWLLLADIYISGGKFDLAQVRMLGPRAPGSGPGGGGARSFPGGRRMDGFGGRGGWRGSLRGVGAGKCYNGCAPHEEGGEPPPGASVKREVVEPNPTGGPLPPPPQVEDPSPPPPQKAHTCVQSEEPPGVCTQP